MPSFALVSPRDVELGLLATAAPSADVRQIGRRVALQIQDTLLGAKPEDLPVRRELQLQLALNMATARAIGLSPPFEVLNRAVIFHRDVEPGARPLTLQQVVEESVRVNLDLQSEDRVVAAGRQDVFIALSTLLPQASAATSYTWIDRDRAVGRAERATGAALRAEQVIFEEGLLADLSVSRSSQLAREAFREQVRQDVVQATATAYLTVLRAAATERIRRENLRVTRANLELARTRRRIGAAAATEVYRWESQEANDARDLVLAEADRQIAKLELNRILDRPLEETFTTEDVRPADLTYTFSHPRVQPFLETPARFRLVRDYLVLRGLERAPELSELDAEIRAQERRRESSRRAFYLPSVRAEGELEHFLDESGAGAGERLGDDTEWRVGVEASIPLVTGGRRLAESRQALENLRRLRIDRRAESKRVEDRVRSAATQASASLSAIDLTRRASDAARSNLDLVTESYARGAIDILDLLDAQGTAFTAEQEAASAVYDHMIDLLDLQRATGEFEFFQTPAERDEAMRELERYLQSHASQAGAGTGGQP
jgi:outer membrane protein TolC